VCVCVYVCSGGGSRTSEVHTGSAELPTNHGWSVALASSCSTGTMVLNAGRCCGSASQHACISSYTVLGQSLGRACSKP